MKAEELAVIKERAEKATEGPWYVDNYDGSVRGDDNKFICSQNFEDSDAEFIAHARQDVPKLVVEVERLQAQEHFAEYAIRQNKALWEALSKACESLGADTLDYYEEEGGV